MRRHLTFLATAVLTLLIIRYSGNASAQVNVLPGSASRGEQLLVVKGCLDCHAFDGSGGNRAPDLSRTLPHATSPGLVASAMWNHAPRMWEMAGRQSKMELTTYETADLFAYMYSALYFAPASDSSRGKRVFEQNCADCHTERPGAAGRPVTAWESVNDPTAWAGRMWNHSSKMNEAMFARRRVWPVLSSQDLADLMLYLRSDPGLRTKSSTFGMGEPEKGLPVFERSCESCHSFGPGTGKKIDLLERRAPRTVIGYIAAMWNHTPMMQARGVANFPELDPEEMPDLVAFLFSQSYFFERGDARRGRRVFESKNCTLCHDQRRKETGAPDLSHSAEWYSPITLTSAVWQHTPAMFQSARKEGVAWPQFRGSEMADLIAYLNSRVIVRMASQRVK
jgi:mono/diheme cytochrome c family protein